MKKIQLKGNVPAVTPSRVLLTGGAVFVITLALRLVTLFTNTDFETGFYTERTPIVYLFYIIAVLGTLAVVALSYLSGSMPAGTYSGRRDGVYGILSLLLGAGFAADGWSRLSAILEAAHANGLRIPDEVRLDGTTRDLIEAVLAFLSVVTFLVFAVSSLTGSKKLNRGAAVLFLAPPLWGIVRVLSYFARTISYLVIGELFCEMYAAVFLMIFLFCFARAVTDTGFEAGAWTIPASGIPAAVFCFLAVLPRFILQFTGSSVVGFRSDPVYIAGGAFALLFVLRFSLGLSTEENSEDAEPEIPVAPFEND